jgi:MoaA/NifB/PqqE/SkfB family radical SAM enzyme
MKLLPDWLRAPPAPANRLPVIQIEVTSRCQTQCVFCPRQWLKERWLQGDLAWELYRDCIAPELERFELVYLQGWGEPTLHPRLRDMLDLARQAGCRTGFTSNGARLTPDYSAGLLEAEVAVLSISLAGARAATHQALRVGSHFDRLIANIESLARLKAQAGSPTPWLELHFLMTRANMHELPAFVELAARLGADEAVATNLTYTPVLELDGLRVFGCEEADPVCQGWLSQAQEAARRSGIRFRASSLVMDDSVLECDARPLVVPFVNHLGYVTPCVYLGLAVAGDIPRVFCGQSVSAEPVNFGHASQGLLAALDSPQAMAFKQPLRKLKIATHPAMVFAALATNPSPSSSPLQPMGCRTCYKQYGL